MWLWGTGMACIAGAIVLFLIGGAVYYQLKLNQRKEGWTREEFVAEFRRLDVPEAVSGAVYDYYRRQSILRSYRVSPDDSLEEVYAASHDEIDDAALEICKKLGVELPPESVLRQWPTPLQTVRDMVLWLTWVSAHRSDDLQT
jgi:hypothetical protein